MTMNIYDIKREIEACVDKETGEIIDAAKLDALQMERDEKIENVALWIKNLTAEAKAIKEERVALAKRQLTAENKALSLKAYLADALGGKKFQTAKCAVSFRTSQHIEIAEGASIPDEFLKQTVTVDKAGLTKAIKEGGIIEGVALVEGQSILIR